MRPTAPSARVGVGLVAPGFLPVADFIFVLRLRGLAISEYLANRYPVAGTVLLVSPGVLAVMPLPMGWKLGFPPRPGEVCA